MPQIPWTSPAQRVFLWAHIAAFREAQEAKKTDDYLAGVYDEWFLKYPQANESQISKDKKVSRSCNLQSIKTHPLY